jgi:uncharacterized membrane protein SpoIIM required for sporulation
MIVFRLVAILLMIAIGVSLGLYLITRQRRFLTIAWRIFQASAVFVVIFGVLFVVERLLLFA